MRSEAELNKLIAEWCGFFQVKDFKKDFHWENQKRVGNWLEPGGLISTNYSSSIYRGRLPFFTTSLDMLFKWPVLKIKDVKLHSGAGVISYAAVSNKIRVYHNATDEKPAVALARAIEKLIDGGQDGS